MSYQQKGHATRERLAKWSGRNKCKPPWVTAEMRSLLRVLVGWIVSSAATTSLAEGCQRIHREDGEVCDIFIPYFCEEGIKCLSRINAWSVQWLKPINAPTIFGVSWYNNSPGQGERHASQYSAADTSERWWDATHHDWQASRPLNHPTDPPPDISLTKTGPVSILDSCFFFPFFFFFLHGPLTASVCMCVCVSTTQTFLRTNFNAQWEPGSCPC